MLSRFKSSRFSQNIVYGALGFGLPTLIALVSFPILIHALGVAKFGIAQLGQAIGSGATFIDLGMTNATVFFVAKRHTAGFKVGEILATSSAVILALAACIAILVVFSAPMLPRLFKVPADSASQAIAVFNLAALQILFVPIISIATAYFKGIHKFYLASGLVCLMSLLTWGASALFALITPLGLIQTAAIFTIGTLLTMLAALLMGAWPVRLAGFSLPAITPRIRVFREMWGYSAAVFGQGLAGMLNNQIQRMLVSVALGPAAVTVYVTAMQLATKIHSGIGATFEAFFPLVASATDRRRILSVYRRVQVISIGAALFILVPLALYAPIACRLWLGRSLALLVYPYVRILAVATIFSISTIPTVMLLNGLKRPGVTFGLTMITIAVNAIYLLLNLGHLSLDTFVTGYALAMVVTALGFVAYAEIVVWRTFSFRKLRQGRA
jgi:O-antigen/teichoic acid export membrane protein